MQFNAEIEIDTQKVLSTDDLADTLVESLHDLHPAIGTTPSGQLQLIVTIEATSERAALGEAFRRLRFLTKLNSIRVETTVDFDRRIAGLVPLP